MSENNTFQQDLVRQQLESLLLKSNLESIGSEEDIIEHIAPMTDKLAKNKGEAAAARGGALKMTRGESVSSKELFAVEAIILPQGRPVIDVQNNTYKAPANGLWAHLGDSAVRKKIESVIPSVGRVELPNHPSLPYGGTAFVVGRNLLMTNRHVAEIFSLGLGRQDIRFRPGSSAKTDFREEFGNSNDITVDVAEVAMIHPYWDMALLRVSHLPEGVQPLELSTASPEALDGQSITLIGYPAFDPRNDTDLQNRIFGGVYNVKRLMPGYTRDRKVIRSFANYVNTLTHDATSLGGASGSPTIELETGKIVGLHFAGTKNKANYAVPTYELARDPYVVDEGVNFSGTIPGPAPGWLASWRVLESGETTTDTAPSADSDTGSSADAGASGLGVSTVQTETQVGSNGVSLTIPLHVQISLGDPITQPVLTVAGQPIADEPGIEAPKTIPDSDYSNREGYDPAFLGAGSVVEVPWLSDAQYAAVAHNNQSSFRTHLLPYENFSLSMNGQRGLAFFTAVNIDGDQAMEVNRNDFDDFWVFDPRIEESAQLGNDYYKKSGGIDNPLDRGHLVRRLDPCWGPTRAKVLKAHHDTFHYTNSSPQHKNFNRNTSRWLGVENFILKKTKKYNARVTVFSGPVLREDDPIYATPTGFTLPIPLEYWKVVAFLNEDGKLSVSAYLLSQKVQIDPIIESLIFGNFKDYRTSVKHLESITGLSFRGLSDFDPKSAAESVGSPLVPFMSYDELEF